MFKYQIGSLTQMMAMTNYYNQKAEDKAMMNLPFTLHLKGSMNVERLENSIKKVLNNKIMNTYLSVEENNFFAIEKEIAAFNLNVEEAEGTSEEEKVKYVSEFAKAKAIQPLPLFEAEKEQSYFRLFKIDEQYHILLMIVHHTFLDFGAVMIAINSIFGYYRDDNFTVPESSDFSKFMGEELDFYQSDEYKKEELYWNKELENLTPFSLTAEKPDENRPPVKEEDFIILLDKKELENIASKNRTSLFNMTMLIIHMAIAKTNGCNDTLAQYAISNRSDMEYRFTLGCLTRILMNRANFEDNMNVAELNKFMRKKIGDGYQNRHVAGNTPLGSVPYVIANEDMGDLDIFPVFNGNPVAFDFVDLPRKLDFLGILILPVSTENIAINILTDVEAYGEHAKTLINSIKLAAEFLKKYPEKTFGDFMRKDITLDTLSTLNDSDIEIIEI